MLSEFGYFALSLHAGRGRRTRCIGGSCQAVIQPNFRIHIKWWVLLCVYFYYLFLFLSGHNKNAISMLSEFGYFALS